VLKPECLTPVVLPHFVEGIAFAGADSSVAQGLAFGTVVLPVVLMQFHFFIAGQVALCMRTVYFRSFMMAYAALCIGTEG
jgi:hypothetical protein